MLPTYVQSIGWRVGIGTEMRAILLFSDAYSSVIAHYFLFNGGHFSKLRAIFSKQYSSAFYCGQQFDTDYRYNCTKLLHMEESR